MAVTPRQLNAFADAVGRAAHARARLAALAWVVHNVNKAEGPGDDGAQLLATIRELQAAGNQLLLAYNQHAIPKGKAEADAAGIAWPDPNWERMGQKAILTPDAALIAAKVMLSDPEAARLLSVHGGVDGWIAKAREFVSMIDQLRPNVAQWAQRAPKQAGMVRNLMVANDPGDGGLPGAAASAGGMMPLLLVGGGLLALMALGKGKR